MTSLTETLLMLLVALSPALLAHGLPANLDLRSGPLETFRMRDLDKIPVAYRSRAPNYLPVFRVSDEEERDLDEKDLAIPNKPIRDDGIGRMLLKNLRFRDLAARGLGRDVLANILRMQADSSATLGQSEGAQSTRKGPQKRQSVSVSQLAELLHNLKSRAVEEDGVKLQSLRFGRK